MFTALGRLVVRRARLTLFGSLVVLALTVVLGGGVFGSLSTDGFDDPSLDSARASKLLEDEFGAGTPNILLVVTADGGDVDAPDAAAAGLALATELAAVEGLMVWIFQDGNLSGPLGFTATGLTDTAMPLLMFAVAFGLSMDYEVFLLARMKEEYDRTGDNHASIVTGLAKTGRIVTAAALVLSITFFAFGCPPRRPVCGARRLASAEGREALVHSTPYGPQGDPGGQDPGHPDHRPGLSRLSSGYHHGRVRAPTPDAIQANRGTTCF
ncbi:MMPL family transporter [Plantactinospora sp. CA-294935]|uniref:MMPL family transporter n=1 Tax=Plantactinospora sp. CA-294935 TaxID=3240012 RepID=UPI003D92F1BB